MTLPLEITTCMPQEYDQRTWNKLPFINEAFRYIKAHPISDDASEQIGNVFLKHCLLQTFSLVLLHRHFDLQPNEKLVEYGNVATPWQSNTAMSQVHGRIFAKSWTFIEHELCPYEFGFDANPNTPQSAGPPLTTEFVRDLESVLTQHQLKKVLGITLWDGSDRRLEFTTGRASITLPMPEYGVNGDTENFVDACWTFQVTNPDDISRGVCPKVSRSCNRCCHTC